MSAATLRADEEEEEQRELAIGILSIVGFLGALCVLTFQLLTANVWLNGDWGKLFE